MIGLPLYRLLVAAALVLSSAAATTRLGHAEPKPVCDGAAPAGGCTHPDEPIAPSRPRPSEPRVVSGDPVR